MVVSRSAAADYLASNRPLSLSKKPPDVGRVLLGRGLLELLEQLALLAAQVLRRLDVELDVEVADVLLTAAPACPCP